jgi:hypothetical protein
MCFILCRPFLNSEIESNETVLEDGSLLDDSFVTNDAILKHHHLFNLYVVHDVAVTDSGLLLNNTVGAKDCRLDRCLFRDLKKNSKSYEEISEKVRK